MTKITDIEGLRAVIGEEIPGLADKNIDHLDDYALAFIERSPLLILSTTDAAGGCDASPKGDAPGFVIAEDKHTLLVPDRPGNKLAYGHQNILENPHVGLLFMIPGTSETLRVNGTAELVASKGVLESLAARGKPAVLAIRISVQECFFHCGKAFIRSGAWKPETWPEKHKVSFGEMYAARAALDDKAGADLAAAIDESIAVDYSDNL